MQKAQESTGNEFEFKRLVLGVARGEQYVDVLFYKVISNPGYAMLALRHDDVLRLASMDGTSVAHHIAAYNPEAASVLASRPKTLSMANKAGTTVAHRAAVHEAAARIISHYSNMLAMQSQHYGTVAHVIAKNHPKLAFELFKDRHDILYLKDKNGTAVIDLIDAATKYTGTRDETVQKEIALIRSRRE